MVPVFWHKHSTKVFVLLFILLSALILFLDIETTEIFGFTFEEEIFPCNRNSVSGFWAACFEYGNDEVKQWNSTKEAQS